MNEAFEKIINSIKELADYNGNAYIDSADIIEIVQEVAEEYAPDTNVVSNGWIACSERLPEENQEVILQDFYGNITIGKMKITDGIEGFSDGDWWASANNYVAWQKLPEPFKERD